RAGPLRHGAAHGGPPMLTSPPAHLAVWRRALAASFGRKRGSDPLHRRGGVGGGAFPTLGCAGGFAPASWTPPGVLRSRVLRPRCCHGTEAAGPRAVAAYAPRTAIDTVLHGVIREHLETFLAAAAARTDGVGLPHFIEREFRAFLRCGLLVHGFLRARCD